ncbi:helix-turn-helix transcriptional regulator [Nocardioides marmoribigeumensis]|uniref:ArsR family transcriptional regulator n=1 Tax=Nocardioides marmoribigeumensis TaxID=433649 RepID=A0ABU2BUX3_9ACTN|nr:helix-turn-helix domain-containing protein [Nocardioides marmoribigeumensis]MDR7362051.1 putative ArsR family transcriptional regulator [Nocardioides marmoribigeumensis]
METPAADGRPRDGYGPRPGVGRSSRRLSPSRSALLDLLRSQDEPVTLAALVSASGLHPNTVREHVEALVRAGLARRRTSTPSGPGRPARLYEATGVDVARTPEYAGLAATLAASLHRTSPSPTEDAVDAGREWGHRLAEERGATVAAGQAPDPAAARREVVALLDDLGFDPEPDAEHVAVRLTCCPLLDAAQQWPDVVCGVHLGLTRGALEAQGADPEGTELLPFSEPGACRLQLAHRAR